MFGVAGHATPPPSRDTPCSRVWSKTLQPILILSSYELGKVESVIWLEEKMENACPLEGSRDEEPQNKMKTTFTFSQNFQKVDSIT